MNGFLLLTQAHILLVEVVMYSKANVNEYRVFENLARTQLVGNIIIYL